MVRGCTTALTRYCATAKQSRTEPLFGWNDGSFFLCPAMTVAPLTTLAIYRGYKDPRGYRVHNDPTFSHTLPSPISSNAPNRLTPPKKKLRPSQ